MQRDNNPMKQKINGADDNIYMHAGMQVQRWFSGALGGCFQAPPWSRENSSGGG